MIGPVPIVELVVVNVCVVERAFVPVIVRVLVPGFKAATTPPLENEIEAEIVNSLAIDYLIGWEFVNCFAESWRMIHCIRAGGT